MKPWSFYVVSVIAEVKTSHKTEPRDYITRVTGGKPIAAVGSSSSSYPYPTKWGQYNKFSSCCDNESAIIFTIGRLLDIYPP
jgi:hypothetical protein